MRTATLCFPVENGRVLLGLKKRGFGQGKYNGFGGKVEPGESIVHAAARELAEEAGLAADVEDLQLAAMLTFYYPAHPEWNQHVHVYVVRHWTGSPHESDEMRPEWFAAEQLPLHAMWQDDGYWLPRVLAGEQVCGTFTFEDDNETVSEAEVSYGHLCGS